MDEPGAFLGGDLLPGNHAVFHASLSGQLVERADIGQPDELGPLEGSPRLTEGRVAPGDGGGDIVDRVRPRAFDIVQVGMNGHRHVGRQRPRRRRPHEQPVVGTVPERQRDGHRLVGDLGIGIQHLVLGDRGAASRTPRHRAMSHVQPAALVAALQEGPVVRDVGIGHREVGVGPVHPLAQPPGLLRLECREMHHPLAAGTGEALETERFDLPLRVEPERLLDLDFHPQSLAVEAILESLLVAAQRSVALDDVLERAAPRMMDTHRIVRGDRAVEEGEASSPAVPGDEAREDALALPELQRVGRDGDEVERPRRGEHARLPLSDLERPGFRRCENETAARNPDGRGIRESGTATVSSHRFPH